MCSPISPSPLQRYLKEFPDIPGFFQYESMVIWDFLYTAQQRLGVNGNLLEIGVYKGKSAVLAALYMRPQEWCVFVDINPMPESEAAIHKFHPSNNLFLQCRSGDLLSHRELREAAGTFRWCHVDADHTGYSTMHDMEVAAYLLCENGIICVDDFFNFRYPQLTAAVYQFLAARPFQFRMLFCGANKCYICRPTFYAFYEEEIRQNFARCIQDNDLKYQLNKTSYASDMGCFSMSWREGEQLIKGMDDRPDVLVF